MRIPIKDARDLAKKRKQTHVIIFTWDGTTQQVITYGKSVEHCSQAADIGNQIKKGLGWPDNLQAQPSRVRALQAKIKELESRLLH